MPADLSEYERRRSIRHELEWRFVLTLTFAWKTCGTRKCGRDRACTGPMLVSPHQNAKVRIQRAIGLSGHACARLPPCMATTTKACFENYDRIVDAFQSAEVKDPGDDLADFARFLRRRCPAASATLDIPARSSDFKETNGQGRKR